MKPTTENTYEAKRERLEALTSKANDCLREMCWARGRRLQSATSRYYRLLDQIGRICP